MLASRLALPRLTPPPLVQLVLGVASLTLVPRSRQFILPTEGKRLECGCLLPTLRGQSIPPPLLLAAAVLADASSPRFSSLVMRIRLGRGERSGSDCRAPICRLSFQSLHRHLHHRPHRQSECRSPGQLSGITVWWSSNWSSAGRTAAVVVCPIVRNASDASRGPRAAVKITSVVGAAHPPSLSSARVPPRQMARLGRGSWWTSGTRMTRMMKVRFCRPVWQPRLSLSLAKSREQSIWPPLRPAAESREQSLRPPRRQRHTPRVADKQGQLYLRHVNPGMKLPRSNRSWRTWKGLATFGSLLPSSLSGHVSVCVSRLLHRIRLFRFGVMTFLARPPNCGMMARWMRRRC